MMSRGKRRPNGHKVRSGNEQQGSDSRRSNDDRCRPSSSEALSTHGSGRHQSRRPQMRKQEQTSAASSHSQTHIDHVGASSSTQQQAVQESDIPGYYYDEEKKTYFKILPNTMSSVGSFVTKETIKKKEAEKQRLSDLNTINRKPLSQKMSQSWHSRKYDSHFIKVLRDVQCGQFTCQNLQTYMIRNMCLNLHHNTEGCSHNQRITSGDIQKMEINPSRDKVVIVTSSQSALAQCIQLLTIEEQLCPTWTDKSRKVLHVTNPQTLVGPVYKKINTLSWAPMTSLPGQHTILFTTMCPIGCYSSIACVQNLDAPTTESMKLFEFNLGLKTVWSSAWSSHLSRFSVGSEHKCHLIDVTTRKKWTFGTYFSDPLSQLFSPTNASVMYNGTRHGMILTHDIRTSGKYESQSSMQQGFGVCCLRLMRDENYLLASDFTGTICTWDQRMRKEVNRYKGLVNSHYQLPFHLDETETLLCASGSDSYTKIWDWRSGELLSSLPPPHSASLETFPLSFYSNQWAGVDGNRGLLIAMRNQFEFYCK